MADLIPTSTGGLPTGNYTINFRQGLGVRLSDVQRNYAWDLTIPIDLINRIKMVSNNRGKSGRPLTNVSSVSIPTSISSVANYLLIEEDFIIKCRSASIPNKNFETIETSFMGHKKILPSKPTFSNTLDVEYEEVERQSMKKFFDDWQFAIYNSDFYSGGDNRKPDTGNAGNATYNRSSYTTDLQLAFYGYNGIGLDKNIIFYNAWPKEVKEAGVTYNGGAESIKYSVTFAYDFWELQPNPIVKIPKVV